MHFSFINEYKYSRAKDIACNFKTAFFVQCLNNSSKYTKKFIQEMAGFGYNSSFIHNNIIFSLYNKPINGCCLCFYKNSTLRDTNILSKLFSVKPRLQLLFGILNNQIISCSILKELEANNDLLDCTSSIAYMLSQKSIEIPEQIFSFQSIFIDICNDLTNKTN